MPEDVVYYVTNYGYLAIFILIFLQEVGFPNPFPNELLLIFSGYLSYTKILFLPFIILTAISADFIAANIIYFVFYKTGVFILQKKPRWIPLSSKIIEKLSSRIAKRGNVNIFIFRITPFTRGYTSVISGLIHIRPGTFLPIIIFSGITWATFWVLTGHLIGPFWNNFIKNAGSFKVFMIILLGIGLFTVLIVHFIRNKRDKRHNSDQNK
jgi:membrane protein DedA with SNARE-associated domain